MWGTAEGGSGTLFITVLLLDEMRTSWMYYGRVQAFCNAPMIWGYLAYFWRLPKFTAVSPWWLVPNS